MVTLGNGKIVKMVEPVGARKWQNVKTGRSEIDTNGKMSKPLSALNGKIGKNGKTANPEGSIKWRNAKTEEAGN